MKNLIYQFETLAIVVLFCFNFHLLQSQPFVEQTGVIPVSGIYKLVWGDYDNDGDLDFLVNYNTMSPNYTLLVKVYKNNGNGTFTEQATIPTSLNQLTPAWGDYDNDNDLDILISGGGVVGTNPYAEIYRNDGNSTFTKLSGISIVAAFNGAAAWADFDNDNDLDVFYIGASYKFCCFKALP